MTEEILLVGNPNAGKTTFFNSLVRANEHVGNWHGVTVEEKKKEFSLGGKKYMLVDTPGIYSLTPLSFEEEVSTKLILGSNSKIINICDLNNLQRNLYLTLCLIEAGKEVCLVLNEIDRRTKFKVSQKKLEEILGVKVLEVNAEKNITEIKKLQFFNKKTPKYLKKVDFSCISHYFSENNNKTLCLIKAFERDRNFLLGEGFKESEVDEIFKNLPSSSMEILAKARYQFLDEVINECCQSADFVYGKSKFDKILLNKFLAFPCFFLILGAIFYLTFFSLGAFMSSALSSLLGLITEPISQFLISKLGEGFWCALFNDALFGGLNTVLSFLPQVVLLFFFLSLLEDSGYLSRVAFIFEDILSKVGLSGKSVYTLLMGFGCSTTAIMTARNMDNRNSKIKTALVCPYMSCSAKIPIYAVVGGAFFGAFNIFVILGLYLLGVIVAITVSKLLDMTFLKSDNTTFILEFPPYRHMSLRRTMKVLLANSKQFLIKIGSVMIAMNVIVFLLSSFSFSFRYCANGEGSILQSLGKFLAPCFAPLGFDNWAVVSALLAGLIAKEVVVSSIAMFNGIDAGSTQLIKESILLPTSVIYFASYASVLSFLVFSLLYVPCLASISTLLDEVGKKWTIVGVIIELFTAYVVSFVVFNIAFAIGIYGWTFVLILLAFVFILLSLIFIYRFIKRKKCPFNCKNCQKKCLKK